jgi:cell division protein ZapE
LCDRWPEAPADHLIADVVPPPRFSTVRFDTCPPDPAEPSQAAAVAELRKFEDRLEPPPRRWFCRPAAAADVPGVYLDGGYGVGKTHL